MKPSTSYGSSLHGVDSELESGQDDDFDSAFHNPSDRILEEPSSSSPGLSTVVKPMAIIIGLFIATFSAVSISQYSGFTSNSKTNFDTVERPIYSNLEDYEKEALFRTFVEDFDKKYKTDEYLTKFDTFKEFLILCDARNMAEANNGGTAIHGITMFADLQDVEFIKYLGYVATTGSVTGTTSTVAEYSGSSTSVDWTGTYTTAVKDQGYCSSCWAFSAVEQLESDSMRLLGLTSDDVLSTQQLVSCDSADSGCSGGDPQTAFEYVQENGLVLESAYAYSSSSTGESGTCDYSNVDYLVSSSGYSIIGGDDATAIEASMADYVLGTGPLSVCLDASTWSSYVSGVMSVCSTTVNHCAQVVGVNTDEGYWKIRNSWGTSWGESGYIYLKTDEDLCAITSLATFTTPYKHGATEAPTAAPSQTPAPTQTPTEAPSEAASSEPTQTPTAATSEGSPTASADDWGDDGAADDDWDDDA